MLPEAKLDALLARHAAVESELADAASAKTDTSCAKSVTFSPQGGLGP